MPITRRDITALVILITLFTIPSIAVDSSQDALPASTPGTLTFSEPVRFGQRLLAAGTYEFRCVHKGTHHLMMVHRIFADAPGRANSLGKRVATDYCRMETLPQAVKASSVRITRHASGTGALEEVRIEGEQVRHIFGEGLGFDRADYL